MEILKKEFEKNKLLQKKQLEETDTKPENKPKPDKTLVVGGIKLTSTQIKTLENGEAIFLKNIQKKTVQKCLLTCSLASR